MPVFNGKALRKMRQHFLACPFYVMAVRQKASGFLPSLYPPFRFRSILPCSACLRSTAARRLAQNAPPEHFAGFQPSLPRTAPSAVLNLGRCQKHHLLCIWGLAHFRLRHCNNKKKLKISIFFSSSCIFFNIFFNCIYRDFFLI